MRYGLIGTVYNQEVNAMYPNNRYYPIDLQLGYCFSGYIQATSVKITFVVEYFIPGDTSQTGQMELQRKNLVITRSIRIN